MGPGIAVMMARAGSTVHIMDVDEKAIERAREVSQIAANALTGAGVWSTEQTQDTLTRLHFTTSMVKAVCWVVPANQLVRCRAHRGSLGGKERHALRYWGQIICFARPSDASLLAGHNAYLDSRREDRLVPNGPKAWLQLLYIASHYLRLVPGCRADALGSLGNVGSAGYRIRQAGQG